MIKPTVAVDNTRRPDRAETIGGRIQQLLAEARGLADEHVEHFTQLIADLQEVADEIAAGGDSYPVGIREEARQLREHLGTVNQRLARGLINS